MRRKLTEEHKKNKSIAALKIREVMAKNGKLGAAKRWKGHIKVKKIYSYPRKTIGLWAKSFDPLAQLEKKRFRNQRYKARRRNALGNHTLDEWLALKAYYQNMCLCCKRQEPEVKLTEDHIIPLSKNGSDYIENIQPLCVSCNTRKHTKIMSYLSLSNINYLNYGRKGE